MNLMQRMKQNIEKARAENGEPPREKHRCCTSPIVGRHTITCPMRERGPIKPDPENQDTDKFLQSIQAQRNRRGK